MNPGAVESSRKPTGQGGPIKFSIVTNAFNQGRFLPDAMMSVLAQDGVDVDIEYIVVDPGSTDHTRQVVSEFMERYPGRICYLTDPDRGPADGLNMGFERATGEIFGYLNADDFYLPGAFRRVLQAAAKHPQADVIYGDGYQVDFEKKCARRVISTPFTPRRFVYGGALVLQQSTFYRADAFRKVGGFNPENRTSWDAELLLEMALRNMRFAHIPEYWSVFRMHPESITGSQRLAAESHATHARYFQRVMGRDKTNLDRVKAKFVRWASVLVHPRSLAVRIADHAFPSGKPLGSKYSPFTTP